MKDKLKLLLNSTKRLVFSPFLLFHRLCFYTGFFVIVSVIGISLFSYGFYASLPGPSDVSFEQLKRVAQKSISFRRENKKLTHVWTPLSDISRDCIYAIVMSEDANFFQHRGVDVDAIIDSIAENLRKRKYEYGASTISQQVIKNLFLSSQKSILRKFKEILIVDRVERLRNKNEILELYLNVAELGRDLYGVREAAQYYFKKKPSQLNAAEGAFLALMLPSPRKYQYSVFENKNMTTAKKRKIRRILSDMMAEEYISMKQYREYLKWLSR